MSRKRCSPAIASGIVFSLLESRHQIAARLKEMKGLRGMIPVQQLSLKETPNVGVPNAYLAFVSTMFCCRTTLTQELSGVDGVPRSAEAA